MGLTQKVPLSNSYCSNPTRTSCIFHFFAGYLAEKYLALLQISKKSRTFAANSKHTDVNTSEKEE